MSEFQFHQSLLSYNTFGVDATARAFIEINSVNELQNVLIRNAFPIIILGGGSNILLTGDLDALVVKNNLLGKTIVEETDDYAIVEAGAGENWHELVLWSLGKGLSGLENLSLIPGLVGAAPIQNIGAYGVELKDVFVKLEAVGLATGKITSFSKEECQFGYRDSIFKKALKGKYCITKIYLRLSKKPSINISYGAIADTLKKMEITKPTAQDVSNAIIQIRSSKLPDPKILSNSGSFFKNPEIDHDTFEKLRNQFPDIVFYELPDNQVKIPAGWLIEQCGWKGKQVGNVGCHDRQALVLINYGGATGQELLNLARIVAQSVKEKFGIDLSPEVNIY